MKGTLKYSSWKDLFDWLYICGPGCLLRLDKFQNSYAVSCDGISYFPISNRMAKKLIKEFGVEVTVI